MEQVIAYSFFLCALVLRFIKSRIRWYLVATIILLSSSFITAAYVSLNMMAEWLQNGIDVKYFENPDFAQWPNLPAECHKKNAYLFVRLNHDKTVSGKCTPNYLSWNLAWWNAYSWDVNNNILWQ